MTVGFLAAKTRMCAVILRRELKWRVSSPAPMLSRYDTSRRTQKGEEWLLLQSEYTAYVVYGGV